MESAGYVPAIGATSEIGPRASAAKSESVASARKMPLAAGSQSSGQQMRMMSPLMTSQAERNNTPAKVTARTVEIGPTVREGNWARKSVTPQDSAATSPSKAELTELCLRQRRRQHLHGDSDRSVAGRRLTSSDDTDIV